MPDLALSGTLDGEADLHGPAARPEGRYALTVSKLVAPQTRQAGLPPIDASAKGTLSDGQASLDGRVTAGRGVALTVAGTLPVEAGGPSISAPAERSTRRSPILCSAPAARASPDGSPSTAA